MNQGTNLGEQLSQEKLDLKNWLQLFNRNGQDMETVEMARFMIDHINGEKKYWLELKEGRDLYRKCRDIVRVGVVRTEIDEAHDAVTKYVGSAGQMIWEGSDYWKKNKPKRTNEDWIELDRCLAEKRKRSSRPFRNLPAFSEIVNALGGTIRNGKAMCRCPAHDDRSPSLSIKESNGRVIMHCFAGCSYDAILDALKGMVSDVR
jgi:hypothetical protein